AVLAGLRRTGPVVALAAGCITVVFLGFLTGRLGAVQQVGFGMAVAVAIDVILVRGLLMPALLHLLAGRNWWAPGPLRRLAPGPRPLADGVPRPAATVAPTADTAALS
ncbi:MMPL family transporter, partial [Plantactinospora siamensis]